MKVKEKKTKKYNNFFSKNWRLMTIIILAIIFFVISSSYNFIAQSPDYVKWGSPDENANYVFSKVYSNSASLTIKERYNLGTGGIIHPRSFKSDGPWLKPLSFLGVIIIFGKIASIFGNQLIPYLTPIFASIGLVFFYLWLQRIFTKRIAFLSSLLLFSFPVYIYYTSRSMFHNVLFVVFVIIFLYFSTYIVNNKKIKTKFLSYKPKLVYIFSLIASYLAGLFLALALITRTSEVLWLMPVVFLAWIFYFRSISIIKILLFLSGMFTGLLPMFYYNQILYGAFWQGGYSEMNESLLTISKSSGDLVKSTVNKQTDMIRVAFNNIKDTIFYFGLKPWQSVKMFIIYFAKMFWYLFIPLTLGFLILLANIYKWPKKYWLYIVSWLFLSAVLIFYYGSWKFTDNPDASSHTIGNSYTRYWLPIYLGSMPIIAIFFDKFSKYIFKQKKCWTTISRNGLIAIFIFIIYLLSFYFLIFGSEEGLYYTYFKFKKDQVNVEKVWGNTEQNAVIVTEFHDKLLFPERKVIRGLLTDPNMNHYYGQVAKKLPLYYFNFTFPEKDIKYLNERKLPEHNMNIRLKKEISSEFSLYELYFIDNKLKEN
ncbi:MAG TPA: hypothetical protein VJ926_01140 [Patescibacteria group bacterium]|nr:hypothetical protein [Patescibacteria group bacterium]